MRSILKWHLGYLRKSSFLFDLVVVGGKLFQLRQERKVVGDDHKLEGVIRLS